MKILILLLLNLQLSISEKCIIDQERRVKALGTKTPYAYGHGNLQDIDLPCPAEKIWLLSRHGTRYPSKQGIKLMNEVIPTILENIDESKTKLCPEDLKLMNEWNSNAVENQAKNLHPEGELELLNLGENYQNFLPDLLNEDYHDQDYSWRSTKTQRTKESLFYFATGMFGKQVAYNVKYFVSNTSFDPIIRFYKGCDKWQKEVKHNKTTMMEQEKFENSQDFKATILDPLSDLLTQDIDLVKLEAIWVSCTFGQAWHPKKLTPWCNILSENQVKYLAYREDLEYFYVDSYGHEINYDQACVLIKDVIKQFDKQEDKQKANFYFSHSGTLLKFQAFLGLSEPKTSPTADNMNQHISWNTSEMDSFANNIAFIKLSPCDKIGMIVNEKLTQIPNCTDLWCSYEEFKAIFDKSMTKCDLQSICKELKVSSNDSEDDKF